jgi:CRP/FNR family cyclic AMP-dependent transcriptional regulator
MQDSAMTTHNEASAAQRHLLKLQYLQGHELFCDFDREQLEIFHDTIQMRTCRAGHVFFRPGETGEVIFMLKEGSAQLYRLSPDGRKFVFGLVPAGSVFGEMSCIGQGMYDCFAEAAEDSVICTMSRPDVMRLIHQHPAFAIRLLEAVGRRVLHAERQLEDLAFRGLIPRLATFLLEQARDGELNGLSHQEIAERLGVYRETATYALNELRAAGLIEIGRRRIRLIDAGGLQVHAARAGT